MVIKSETIPMNTKIERDNPEPLHHQLTEIIKQRIKDEKYPANSKLPSEREFCEEFDVSRTTIRETIRKLKEEGLIEVHRGRGAFVVQEDKNFSLSVSLDGFSADVIRQGKIPSSKLIGLDLIAKPDKELVKTMKLNPGNKLVKVERIRLANAIPLAIHTSWLNHRFCPDISNFNLAEISIISILKVFYHLNIVKADQTVFASLANTREQELLSLPNPSAILKETRVTYLDSGDIVEFSKASYCGDFYHLLINMNIPS